MCLQALLIVLPPPSRGTSIWQIDLQNRYDNRRSIFLWRNGLQLKISWRALTHHLQFDPAVCSFFTWDPRARAHQSNLLHATPDPNLRLHQHVSHQILACGFNCVHATPNRISRLNLHAHHTGLQPAASPACATLDHSLEAYSPFYYVCHTRLTLNPLAPFLSVRGIFRV